MIATVVVKADMTKQASSAFPAADIFDYYETNACFHLIDREFIIKKGFQEWLLAVIMGRTVETAASRIHAFAQHPVRHETDIVTLLANLVGGGANEKIFRN